MSFCVGGKISGIFGTPSSKFGYQILSLLSQDVARDVGLYGGCAATIGKGAKCFDFA